MNMQEAHALVGTVRIEHPDHPETQGAKAQLIAAAQLLGDGYAVKPIPGLPNTWALVKEMR